MARNFDTLTEDRHFELCATVFGKIILGIPKEMLGAITAKCLEHFKAGTARSNDLLRITAMLDVSLPERFRQAQANIIQLDQEIEAKQREAAQQSRATLAEKRKAKRQEDYRAAIEKAECEIWKTYRNRGALPQSGSEGSGGSG